MIIGKKGEQPFKISDSAVGVSRQHAEVDVNGLDGQWTLRDLNSTNGTYLRDDQTGEFRRITSVSITPMSFIRLGSTNSKGCSFYARQLLAPGNYREEMLYIYQKEKEYEEKKAKVEKTAKTLRIIQTAAPFVIFGLSLLLWSTNGMGSYVIRMASASVPSLILQILYDPKKKLRQLNATADSFRYCPNPGCSQKLNSNDIKEMNCPYCHAL